METEKTGRVAGLFIYPIKSCKGIQLSEALTTENGFEFDRLWMITDNSYNVKP